MHISGFYNLHFTCFYMKCYYTVCAIGMDFTSFCSHSEVSITSSNEQAKIGGKKVNQQMKIEGKQLCLVG